MSVFFNINEIAVAPIRTDVMADCGWGKYCLYSSQLREQYVKDNYYFYDNTQRRSPLVANRLVLYGDVYYTSMVFYNPAMISCLFTERNGYSWFVLSDMLFEYNVDTSLLYIYCHGIRHSYHGYSGYAEWRDYLGAYNLSQVTDIDYSKPFMFHWVNMGVTEDYGNTANKIYSRNSVLQNLHWNSDQYPIINKYVSDHFSGGGLYADRLCSSANSGSLSFESGFRVAYVNTSGQPVDLPYNTFLKDYSNLIETGYTREDGWHHLETLWDTSFEIFSSYSLWIPMTIDEYDASACADYKYPYYYWQYIYDFSKYED